MTEFSLQDTLESGQIFRWKYAKGGAWVCHAEKLFFLTENGSAQGVSESWANHFLRTDQPALTHNHPYVQQALERTTGVRVLRQDPWECLVAFIISQNNHQTRIQQNVLDVSRYGKPLEKGFHAFPKPHELPDEDALKSKGLGYRARHIAALRTIDLTWLYGLAALPYKEAKHELMTLRGVGPKVADCILLFSLGFDEACPEDTWIKKVFTKHNLTREDLGVHAGLIQQALFHHARTNR